MMLSKEEIKKIILEANNDVYILCPIPSEEEISLAVERVYIGQYMPVEPISTRRR